MEQQVVLIQIPLDKMLDEFRKVVNEMLDSREQKVDAIYTRDQTAEKLNISLVTLWEWTRQGLIEAHRAGGRRVYYKSSAVEKALKHINKYTPNNAA